MLIPVSYIDDVRRTVNTKLRVFSDNRSVLLVIRMLLRSSETTIKISAADVDVITNELEVTKEEAHTALLRGNGDVVQALRHLLQ